MFSLNYYKGFSVFRTFSMSETATFICNTANKIKKGLLENKTPYYSEIVVKKSNSENELEESTEESCKDYVGVIKKIKKDNITEDNIGEIMLAQIPGLSITVAQDIMSQYKTINNLINILTTEPECLDNFQVSCKKGTKQGTKKIGKNVVEKIKEFLL